MNIRRPLFIPILLAAAGCEWKTTSRVGVQVTTPLLRTRDDSTGDAPAGGARVRVRCPVGAGEDLGSAGAEGFLLVTTRAAVPLTCDLAIDYHGHLLAIVPVSETCFRKEGGECREVRVRLIVDLRGDASTADSVALRTRCERDQDWVRCWRPAYPVISEKGPWPFFTWRATSPR
jgi:hypothetical protein